MPQNTTTFIVLDGLGAQKTFQAEQDTTSGALTPHHVVETLDAPVSTTNPMPTRNYDGVTLTQTIVSLTAGIDSQLVAANPNRRSLVIANISTGLATLGFGQPAVYSSGLPLDAAPSQGALGGQMTWHAVPPLGSVHAISAAGTEIVVLEGV